MSKYKKKRKKKKEKKGNTLLATKGKDITIISTYFWLCLWEKKIFIEKQNQKGLRSSLGSIYNSNKFPILDSFFLILVWIKSNLILKYLCKHLC